MKAGEAVCGTCGTPVARWDTDARTWVQVPSPGHAWPAIDHTECTPKRRVGVR